MKFHTFFLNEGFPFMKHDSDEKMIFIILRNIFQLHHVHGGEQRGDHHHDPQLSSQTGGHSRDAELGEIFF